MKTIQYKVLDERIRQYNFLTYETDGAAAVDMRAVLDKERVLHPNTSELLHTGLALHIADPSLMGVLVPRSGLGAKHGVVLGNLTGILDSDYQGELMLSCWNRGVHPYTVVPFERIAQLIFVPVVRPQFKEVVEFAQSRRGGGGFGHTGRH